MKIALLTYSTKPRGGVVHTLSLAEALVELGADVSVWTLGRDGAEGFFRPIDPRVELHIVPFPPHPEESVGDRIVRSIAVLRAAFARDGQTRTGDRAYDVVHAQDCLSANAVDRCIRTIHHLDAFTTPELVACHERALLTPYARICVSSAVAAELQAGWGLSATVIPNGVDAERFRTAAADRDGPRQWQRRLGRYVLAVGGIEPRKGTIDLLEAYALLRGRRPDLRLVIAGGETLFDYRAYRAAFDRRAHELGVEPQVLGAVAHDELPALVAGAEVFGFPSTKEGFGLAAMEALAAGVPVVVRDLPVLREVFGGHVRYAAGVSELAAALDVAITAGPLPGSAELPRTHRWERVAAAHLQCYARWADDGSVAEAGAAP